MKRRFAAAFLFAGSMSVLAGTTPASSDGTAVLLAGFADALLAHRDPQRAFDAYASPTLIQHNPMAGDGRQAAIDLVRPLFAAPGARFDASSLIADGDTVFLHYRGTLGGGQSAAVAELYRVERGRLAEHWDAFQPVPPHAVSAHPMFGVLPSAPPAPCAGATPSDRAVVEGFADLLYRARDVRAAFERYAAPGMVQHDPGLADGRQAAIDELGPLFARPDTHITIAHVLACRGMGVIHLRSQRGTEPGHVIFDIVRLEGGRIVEHWDVFQPVATKRTNPRPQI